MQIPQALYILSPDQCTDVGGSESLNSSTLVISKLSDTKCIYSGDYRKSPVNRGFNGIQYLFVSDLECRSKTLLSIVRMFSLSPITCGNEPSLCCSRIMG